MEDYPMKKSAQITQLRVANFKRIEEVTVDIDGNVLIGGANAQGKSSLLDAVMVGLVGGASIPPDPVHHGKDKATISLTLDNGLVVERTITPDRKHKLKVTGRDDASTTPQRWLDDHIKSITLDPLAILSMPAQKQSDLLRSLVGVTTTDLDEDRETAFNERRDVSRDLRAAQAELAGAKPHVADAPKERVSTDKLSQQLQEAVKGQADFDAMQAEHARETSRYNDTKADIERTEKRLAALKAELEACIDAGKKRLAAINAWVKVDVTKVRDQLADAGRLNDAFASNASRTAISTRVTSLEEAQTGLTDVIIEIDSQKAHRLAAAKWPLDGLSIGDAGVTFNGVPLEQASQAEQLRVCVALAAASKPDVGIVLVRDGCRLDAASLKLLLTLVTEAGLQAFVERVGLGDAGAVIIENGFVK
jgi:recombinational DNA repair ATPase RecF